MYHTLKTSNLSITRKDGSMVQTSVILDIRTPPISIKTKYFEQAANDKTTDKMVRSVKTYNNNKSANIRIKIDEVSEACTEKRHVYWLSVGGGGTEGRRLLGRLRHRWEDSIKRNLRETG